jgi:hypothetical protein
MFVNAESVGAFLLAIFIVEAVLALLVVALAVWVFRVTHRRMVARGMRFPALPAAGAVIALVTSTVVAISMLA